MKSSSQKISPAARGYWKPEKLAICFNSSYYSHYIIMQLQKTRVHVRAVGTTTGCNGHGRIGFWKNLTFVWI